LSAVVIFLLLQAAFDSWLLAALAFFSVALSLAGGAVAVWATGGEISLGATAGFLAVGALAARGSVRLLTRFRNAERTEPDLARAEVVKREAGDEMGPALGVAVGAAVAFLPMAAIGSVRGTELVGPMAAVILGGLVSSTLVNLLVLPVGYVRWLGGRRARMETPRTAADAGGPG
jgi:Cu/Ag efflux pump CusA